MTKDQAYWAKKAVHRDLELEPLCKNPVMVHEKKSCGCPALVRCKSCGRVDTFEKDYHREECRRHKGA